MKAAKFPDSQVVLILARVFNKFSTSDCNAMVQVIGAKSAINAVFGEGMQITLTKKTLCSLLLDRSFGKSEIDNTIWCWLTSRFYHNYKYTLWKLAKYWHTISRFEIFKCRISFVKDIFISYILVKCGRYLIDIVVPIYH